MKNEYRKMCSQITPDEKLTEKTLKQFASGEKVHPHKRRAWKPAAAVVAGLLAFAVAFPYIQSTGNHIVPTTGQNKSATNTQNTFGLAAYAADKGTSSEASGNEITFALETGSSAGPNGIKSNASFQITGTNIAKIAMQLDRGKLYQMERVTKQLTSKGEKAEADAFMAAEDKTKQIDADISTFSWQEFKRNGVKEKPSQALYIEGKMLGKSVSVPYDKKYSYGLYAPADEMSKIDPPTAEGKTWGLLYGQHLDKAVDFFDGAILQVTATYKDGTCETKTLHLKTENRRISYDSKNDVNIILPKDTTNNSAPIVKVLCADIT